MLEEGLGTVCIGLRREAVRFRLQWDRSQALTMCKRPE